MRSDTNTVILILGLTFAVVLGLATFPVHFYEKLGSAFDIVVAEPTAIAGAITVISAALAVAVVALRKAWLAPSPEQKDSK